MSTSNTSIPMSLYREYDKVRQELLEILEKRNIDIRIGCEDKSYQERIEKLNVKRQIRFSQEKREEEI